MNTREYVKSLFKDYEETGGLNDFMEELQANLDAHIESLIRKGLSEKGAFDKACAELGDVSVMANELSIKKRREVFEEVYMDIRKYMSAKRVAAYVIFGLVAFFGIITAFISYFAVGGAHTIEQILTGEIDIAAFMGALMPFLVASAAGFTFLGLTQETKSHYPMGKKRAALYTLAAGLIVFSLFAMFITYFSARIEESSYALMSAIGTLIPFALPGGGLMAFLALTEKERLKPWAASFQETAVKQHLEIWNDPAAANRFGIFSGALWILAAALFFLFGFLAGFKYSWIIFLFATAVQLFVQGLMMKKKQSC
jgi:hypothetical protein